jgi:putative DNA primase/helicase
MTAPKPGVTMLARACTRNGPAPPLRECASFPTVDGDARRAAPSTLTKTRRRTASPRVAAQDEADPGATRGHVLRAGTSTDFERGDHVELAQRLLDDLRSAAPTAPVYDRGELRRYNPTTGAWVMVPRDAVCRSAARYAGRMYPGRGGPCALRMRVSDVEGVARLAEHFATAAGFFDAAPTGVAFQNGMVVLRDHRPVLVPHSPDHRVLHVLPFAYDATARADGWTDFLDQVWAFASEDDRAARQALLEEWIGAALFGDVARHALCLILPGSEGANGKSTLLHIVRALFPPAAVQAIKPQLWGNVFHLAELAGCRLNVVNELPDADIVAGETFKAVVSGDPVNAARKHRDPFTFIPQAGHLFACNELPGTRDQTGGFWRRWGVLTFERTFRPAEQDPGLRARLVRTDLPGIAARVLAAAGRLSHRGRFVLPPSSHAAKARWQWESDQVRQFVEDRVPDLLQRGQGRVSAQTLYEAFTVWSRQNGHAGMTSTTFGRRVRWAGLARSRDHAGRFYTLVKPITQAEELDGIASM